MKLGLINQKGGVGKTTLTVNIAYELSKIFDTNEILVLDADPQQSTYKWSLTRTELTPFSVVSYPKKTLYRDINGLADKYQHVVIDSPAQATDIARSCIATCDIALVPCSPGAYDFWASEETLNLIEEAQNFNKHLKVAFVLNKSVKNNVLSREIHASLKKFDAKVMDVTITNRVVFGEAACKGLTVFEQDSKSKSCEELKLLVKELLEFYEQKNIN